jgi:hypothetical protein
MRFLLGWLLVSVMVLAQERFTLQVISVEQKRSITPAFMKKVKALNLPYEGQQREKSYVLCVGDFSTELEANDALIKVRQELTSDAFIVRFNGMQTKKAPLSPDAQMQQAMLMAKARTLQKVDKEKVDAKAMESVEPVKVKQEEPLPPKEKVVITKQESKTVVGMQEDVKTEEIYCKPTKKALRESEISDAIAFYQNSKYYSFNE